MKIIFIKSLLIFCALCLHGQRLISQTAHSKGFVFDRSATVDLDKPSPDYSVSLLVKEMPKPASGKVVQYNYPGKKGAATQQGAPTLPKPIKGVSLFANPFSVATPCDNDLAISDSGIVMSVMNTNIFFRNISTNQPYAGKTLAAFTTPVNNKHQEFDPKVIYDPAAKRFIMVCLVGNVDSTSKVILGFSQTQFPNGAWNLYVLPGDPLNNNLWSDYPMISLTNNELFLSLNLLYNDSTWQKGFVETIVWQINKQKGYNGQPLASNLHSNILYAGKPIRNLCPVKGGSQLYGPNMFFISNRNLASQNDTVFLVNITDTIGSSTASVTVKALTTNQSYYFPPDGRQTITTQSLATNDCRNLGAFFENNKIQYVHNTMNPLNNLSSIYYGVIDNVQSSTPVVTGYIIPNDTMDFAYPNISYAGTSSSDNTSIITFDHSSNKVFPGVSAFQADAAGNFSDILRIQNGNTYVNLINNNLERWGDYTGSQRRYNKPGQVWMSGYFGYSAGSYPNAHGAWIAQLTTSTTPTGTITAISNNEAENTQVSVFPNPAKERVSLSFSLEKPEYLTFNLFDPQGRLVTVLLRDWIKGRENIFSFSAETLASGVYILEVKGNIKTNITKKIVIN